jgi:hypothetical protein
MRPDKFKGYWKTPCDGCSGYNMPYMIQFELWKQVAGPTDDFLCLNCVEQRLGRKLNASDFLEHKTLPINNGVFGFNWQDWVKK